MKPEEVAAWQERLEENFKGPSGVIGERLLKLQRIEQTLGAQLTSTFVGYLTLMDSFLDFYMESIELTAGKRKEQWPELTPFITATHITTFWRFRASYLIFWSGYFIDALSLLRSVFENVLQIAALRHGIITLADAFGGLTVEEASQMSPDEVAKRIRNNIVKADKAVRDNFLGEKSGLSPEAQDDMVAFQGIMHGAVHKSRLNFVRLFGPWVRGQKAMPIYPAYDEDAASLYMNASQGMGWMVVRTLPLLQTQPGEFPEPWHHRWRILEDSFKVMVGAYPKRMGRSIEQVLTKKFTF